MGRLGREQPGFVEIDLVGHEGGDANSEFCRSQTVTDIATGWTEVRSVRNESACAVFTALLAVRTAPCTVCEPSAPPAPNRAPSDESTTEAKRA